MEIQNPDFPSESTLSRLTYYNVVTYLMCESHGPCLQAFQRGLFGSRYAWLLVGRYHEQWWTKNLREEQVGCSEEQMNAAVRGYIACDNARLISGLATVR